MEKPRMPEASGIAGSEDSVMSLLGDKPTVGSWHGNNSKKR